MLVTLSGKGGVGKTTLLAVLLDELARLDYPGRVLAVDADPAMTLHLALGLPEPGATIAQLRESVELDAKTVRNLPAGTTPAAYLRERLQTAGVVARHPLRGKAFDLLAMGQGEGPGCYCRVNAALKTVLHGLAGGYDLVLVDNEAGLEHLSRYRLGRVALFLVVTTPQPAAQAVARRVVATARAAGIEIEESGWIFNRAAAGFAPPPGELALAAPSSQALIALERCGQPVVSLPDNDPLRLALAPLLTRIKRKVACVSASV